ncbi:MAG: branched-chain amino acid aminotransferase [Brevundimonas sp.]|nr:MAG: branched-chain amino acid aminotransferase [Brevundimonas sp.]
MNAPAEATGRSSRRRRARTTILDYGDRSGVIWLNGEFLPWKRVRLPVLTQGLHYGASVFEGERAYEGRIFRSRDHSRRLLHSAARLVMDIPFDVDALEAAKAETLARSGLSDAYVRPVVWRGSRLMDLATQGADVHCAIAAWPWDEPTPHPRVGIRMTLAHWRRPPRSAAPVDAKAGGLYVIASLAKDEAQREGYDDALMLDGDGDIADATGANVFFVRDGELFTPERGDFLDGVTRQTMIQLALDRGIRIHQTKIRPEDLRGFSECFLTGTAAEVTTVVEIAGICFVPGAVSLELHAAYQQAVRAPSDHFPPALLHPQPFRHIGRAFPTHGA